MDLNDRLLHLLIGMVIGAVVGYLTRVLQEIQKDVKNTQFDVHDIKEEVDEIDSIVKSRRGRDERGFMRIPIVADLILIAVISMTAWAAISTGSTNNKLEKAIDDIRAVQKAENLQDKRLETISQCTLEFTSKTILALNERTRYSPALSTANAEVLRAQADFLRIVLIIPPVTDAEARDALEMYTAELNKFNEIARKNSDTQDTFAYPTNKELATCLGVDLPDVETGEKEVK